MDISAFSSAISTFQPSNRVSLTAPKGSVKTVNDSTNFVGSIDFANFCALLKSTGYKKLFIRYFENAKKSVGIFADSDLLAFASAKAKNDDGGLKDNSSLIFTLFLEDDNEVLINGHDASKDNVTFCLSAKSSAPVEVEMDL